MASLNRILIIVTQQLGDVLLTTPLLQAARQRWPDARLDVLGFVGSLRLLEGNPMVSNLVEVPRGGWWANRAVIRGLWRKYDLALITQSSDRAFLYGFVTAPLRSALIPLTGRGQGWKRAIAKYTVLGDPLRHTVMEKLELVAPWVDLATLQTSLTPPALQPIEPLIEAALQARYVVVHVPSMWRYKQWPVAHFRVLIAGLLEAGLQVVLTGDDGGNDQALVGQVRDMAPPPRLLDAAGRLGLGQVATLLSRAAAYIGPDTSLTHLAVAVGTPVLTLFGPTSPLNWGPWPAQHAAAQPWQARGAEPDRVQRRGNDKGRIVLMQGPSLPDTDCVPCRRAGCDDRRDSRSACLEGIVPERVLAEALALLDRVSGAGAAA